MPTVVKKKIEIKVQELKETLRKMVLRNNAYMTLLSN